MPPLPVTALEMQPTRVETSVEAVAQTEGAREVEVRARVGGILEKRVFDEGSPVKAGQALYQIDRAPLETAVAQARAQLAEAKARVEQTQREAARLKGLLAQQAISQREYDTASSDNSVALAAVQAAQAALRQAELNLSYATVTAPVGGISGRSVVSEGTLLATGGGTLLTTVVQVNPMWVRFSIPEAELSAAMPEGRFKPQAIRGVELCCPTAAATRCAASSTSPPARSTPSSARCSCAASSPTPKAACCPASSCVRG
jgi:membrane fusion protein (multidrug efflux system)